MNANPVAIVTGGARGIGEAAVRKFSELGYAVAVLDVNRVLGDALAQELQAHGKPAAFFACDVADAEAVDQLAAEIEKKWVRLRS